MLWQDVQRFEICSMIRCEYNVELDFEVWLLANSAAAGFVNGMAVKIENSGMGGEVVSGAIQKMVRTKA